MLYRHYIISLFTDEENEIQGVKSVTNDGSVRKIKLRFKPMCLWLLVYQKALDFTTTNDCSYL